MLRAAVVFALAVMVLPLSAQVPYLVKDINTSVPAGTNSSSPAAFTKYGDRIYFAATDSAHGTELWSTDGTTAATELVADLVPGRECSCPRGFAVASGLLLFRASDTAHGEELWRSDGTTAGTQLVRDIFPGPSSSNINAAFVDRDRLLFAASGDDATGTELWISDGTTAGTTLLKDLSPGDSSSPQSFAPFGGAIYFGAAGALWKTDATAAGTVQVKGGVRARGLTAAGGNLFFKGFTNASGWELWVSDGTDSGTHMVKEIGPSSSGAFSDSFDFRDAIASFGNQVLFPALPGGFISQLWISDGTESGTHLVRNINAGGADSGPEFIIVIGGVAVFAGDDGVHGQEVWITDGTDGGTRLLRDVIPGGGGSLPSELTASGGTVFFAAFGDVGSSRQLWATDGTEAGTRSAAPADASDPREISVVDAKLFLSMTTPLTGAEPWMSDGTVAGTRMIANLHLEIGTSSSPAPLAPLGDLLFFSAFTPGVSADPSTPVLWRTDGTESGTVMLTPSVPLLGATTRSSFYFSRDETELWRSDGTAAGTFLIKETRPSPDVFVQSIRPMAGAGDIMFFGGPADGGVSMLWRSDGTAAGTIPLGGPTFGLTEIVGRVFSMSDTGPWISDGTANGTFAINPGASAGGFAATPAAAGGVLFYLDPRTIPPGLWKSDGTADDTLAVAPIPMNNEVRSRSPQLFGAEQKLFLFASDSALWVSDGTANGTRTLKQLERSFENSEPWSAAAIGDRIVFASSDPASGEELWISDGTEAGTRIVTDILPGSGSSSPRSFASADGVVYFAADDGIRGQELWMTDGTASGTRLVADLEPGPESSAPGVLSVAGRRLYFAATTTASGRELWAFPLASNALSVSDLRVQEPAGGTAFARMTVRLSTVSTQSITVDYATSNGTAVAGSEYEAASGTLTFAAGEREKNVDVVIRSNSGGAGNTTFFLTLRNASAGAVIAKPFGIAIIEHPSYADLSTSVMLIDPFSGFLRPTIRVANAGPRAANAVDVRMTATPGPARPCSCPIPSIAASGAVSVTLPFANTEGIISATPVARETDPNAANSAASWTMNEWLGIDNAYVPVNGTVTASLVTLDIPTSSGQIALASSDATVLSVPPSVDASSAGPVTFTVRGIREGSATIRTVPPPGQTRSVQLTVIVSNTRPQRWPGGLGAVEVFAAAIFTTPLLVTVHTDASAPYSAATPSGTITITSGGKELARRTIAGPTTIIPISLPQAGTVAYEVNYLGDANFLPSSTSHSVFVHPGDVSITAVARRNGTAATLRITVNGSPAAAPTGTVTISEQQQTLASNVTLIAGGAGTASAEITIPLFAAGEHMLTVVYSGDPRYRATTQEVKVTEKRRRSVRH